MQHHARGNRWHARLGRRRSGFTLVELLVVVSIIALLISILLPSLKRAREQAKAVVCSANLSALSKGNSIYGSEFNGWFIGSPATTGQQLYAYTGAPPASEAVNTPGQPVQIWDWAGPIAAQSSSLNWNRAERWRDHLLKGVFACPSNKYVVVPFPSITTDWQPQEMVSYNAMRAMMTRGGTAPDGSSTRVSNQYFHPQVGGTEQPPYFYEPRVEKVGNPSEKAFLADGGRFIDLTPNNERVTYNYAWETTAGGAFATEAPTAPDAFARSYVRSRYKPQWAVYSYRHPQTNKQLGLNVAFFDGHVSTMTEAESRLPDPWWPKDTVLPISELNIDTRNLVVNRLTTQRPSWWTTGNPPLHYRVRR